MADDRQNKSVTGNFVVDCEVTAIFNDPRTYEAWIQGMQKQCAELVRTVLESVGYDVGDVKIKIRGAKKDG